jgi:Cyclophilin-like family
MADISDGPPISSCDPEQTLRLWLNGRACFLSSATEAKRVQHDGKGRRVLPTARVIEMVPGIGFAPIFQHPHELLFRDVLFDQVLGQVSQPEPVQGGAPCQLQAVDGELDLTIDDYGSNEKIAYLPRKLTEEGSGPFDNERPGDLCYFKSWGNLAMFYGDYRWDGLIRLGRFEGGFESLRVRGKFPLRIERIP